METQASILISALYVAIDTQEKLEKEWGYTSDSLMLHNWKEIKDALHNGQSVIVRT